MTTEAMPVDDMPANSETITFVESYEPPIQAGTYLLTVTQEVTGTNSDGSKIDDKHSDNKTVYVRGERFALDPQDIASVFPPDRNQGDHFNVLPHIVFSRKTLPWERRNGPDSQPTPNMPLKRPWLALLLFHDDDPIPPIQVVKIGEVKGDSGKGIVSYDDAFQKTFSPPIAWNLEPGEDPEERCFVVDVPVELFSDIAPTKEDLGWLAHSREVLEKRQPQTLMTAEQAIDETPPGEYSVMIANRLPKSGGANTAYLVSLEGMEAFLPLDSGRNPNLGQEAKSVRLIMLKGWSFSCTAPHETFKGTFQHLSYGPLQLPYSPPTYSSPSPTNDEAAADAKVKNALAMGYTALNHHTRWGDQTLSWYRGPFVPFQTLPKQTLSPSGTPISTADAALRYDQELGMLDVSYASAWQLGRLLALHDRSFSYALYQWKQQVARKTFQAYHTGRINQKAHIQLLRKSEEQPLPTEEVRAMAFQFVADNLKDMLLSLDGKKKAK